jgi:hypothetical protein
MTHLLPHPDPMPLREVLRGLRHTMRRSRRALRETVSADALPGPAALIAGPVLDGLDTLAGSMDAAGTDLAKRLLGGEAHRVPGFEALTADPGQEEAFAEATYAALRGALHRMGDGDAFVSEAAARRAYAAVVRTGRSAEDAALTAADLALALIVGEAVRDVAAGPALRVAVDRIAPVAAVAAVLWLLADREGADADGALDAATDIAVALSDEIAPAAEARDRTRLARLLGEFASHV